MLHVQCPGCMTSAYVDCICPPEVQAGPGHAAGCPMLNLDAQVTCPDPDATGCCPEAHDHGAHDCHAQHDGEPCPEPGSCRVWIGQTANERHPLYEGDPPGDCPGGHCHKDIDGCAVCRPLIITALPGTQIQTVTG